MSAVLYIDDYNFESEIMNSDKPVIVVFETKWSDSCKKQTPDLDFFENNNRGLVKVCKIDIDNSRELAKQLNITAVPTIILFRHGKPTLTLIGVQTKFQLEQMIPENDINPIC